MRTIIVKAGGSGNIIAEEGDQAIPWLAYRRLKFDSQYLFKLRAGCKSAVAKGLRIVFIPGGMGAYLYIDLARKFLLGEEHLRYVGQQIVDLNAYVALQVLRHDGLRVFPELANLDDDMRALLMSHEVIVLRSSEAVESTDALAAAAAARISGSEVLLFKRGVPVYHVGFPGPTEVRSFRIDELERIAHDFRGRPGLNSILDLQCLSLLRRSGLQARLVNADYLDRLGDVIDGDIEGISTVIEV